MKHVIVLMYDGVEPNDNVLIGIKSLIEQVSNDNTTVTVKVITEDDLAKTVANTVCTSPTDRFIKGNAAATLIGQMFAEELNQFHIDPAKFYVALTKRITSSMFSTDREDVAFINALKEIKNGVPVSINVATQYSMDSTVFATISSIAKAVGI